ncbi:MAG: putative toxin-antitoxin system toxin component, PIN family [Cyanobacteria bacterium M5B4]|nr:MAG: putative toxin-antitoxin system toxin component, PIN family [Cyanobacteria bacterium M5B4]
MQSADSSARLIRMKIVADTNVWISGLLWSGPPAQLLQRAESGQLAIFVSPAILDEIERVLEYQRIQRQMQKLGVSQTEVLTFAIQLMTFVQPSELEERVAPDPQDDMFLACALAAGVPYLVSGDHHLLDMGTWQTIRIVTVNDFLAQHFRA